MQWIKHVEKPLMKRVGGTTLSVVGNSLCPGQKYWWAWNLPYKKIYGQRGIPLPERREHSDNEKNDF